MNPPSAPPPSPPASASASASGPDALEPSGSAPPVREPWVKAYSGAPAVLAITVLNVLVFLGELVDSGDLSALLLPRSGTMLALGANYAAATLGERRFETLLTSCFLHYGILHIGFNMVALRQIGPFVERLVGSGRFAVMYVVSGVLGSATSTAWGAVTEHVARTQLEPESDLAKVWLSGLERVSAGASGAICGVIGAVLVIGVRAQGWRSPLTRDMARWLGTIVLFGLFLRFDNAAHLGGAIAGAIIAAVWRRNPESRVGRQLRLSACVALVVAAALRVGAITLTDPFARYLTEERAKLAQILAKEGHCEEARQALAAARRLGKVVEGDLTDPLAGCR